MDKLRLETLAVRVVEWHNRHPLARRIGVQHVQSIGYVALPYRAGDAGAPSPKGEASAPSPAGDASAPQPAPAGDVPAGASLRERAMARVRQPAAARPAQAASGRPPEAAFDEAFLESISPPLVARWAAQHARELSVEPNDGPVRRVAATGAGSMRAFYAMTALIEIAGQRSRVLVGPGEQPAVLGRRLWSRPRMAAVAGALVVAAGLAWIWQNVPLQGLAPAASPAASSASSAVAASAPVPVAQPAGALAAAPQPAASTRPAVALRADAVPMAASAAVPAATAKPASAPIVVAATPKPALAPPPAASAPASAPAAIAPPLDVEPQLGRITLPPLNLPHGDAARNAARAKLAASAAAQGQASAAAQKSEPRGAMAAAAAPGAPAFAVSTRILRTRAESEQVMVAMQALLATTGARGVRVEIVPAGADWRVVGWPFARRDEADRARALLASRGMRVEVVDF